MSIINSCNTPQLSNFNNENGVFHKLTAKQAVSSVKPKKKALLDVGNTIHQQRHINKEGIKSAEKWKLTEKPITAPNIKSACSPTCIKDISYFHNISICDKWEEAENDNFLPDLTLTPQQLNSYTMDWRIKPQPEELNFKEIGIGYMEIGEPKSPNCGSIYEFDDHQSFDFNFNIIPPMY